MFWFLEYLGHPHVRVLDGGVRGWEGAGHALSSDFMTPVTSSWHGTPVAERVASWREVLERLGRADTTLLDTRSADEHAGRAVRARRGGTIPGAINLEWTENLGPDGAFKSATDLRAMYAEKGVGPDRTVITYCHGGYRAAHSYLALRILGFPDVRNYTGSWKEWGDRDDLPIGHS